MNYLATGLAWLAGFSLVWAETELEKRLTAAGENAGEIKSFVAAAREGYGEFGEKAAVFLVE